jgi:hypothetical protein
MRITDGQTDLLHPDIREKLAGLRRALTGRLAVEGAAWTVVSLVALVFGTLAFDYLLRLERPLRALIMVAALAGVAWVLWRSLLRPLRVPMGMADLAMLVEGRFGQLGDRLISAVLFSGRSPAETLGASQAMISHMAAEANAIARPLPLGQIVERRGIFRSWSVACCALALLLGFGILQGDLLNRWFWRNVLLADVPWPQATYVRVEGKGDFVVMRGDDLRVEVNAEDRSLIVPSYVELHATYPGIGRTEERVEPEPGNPKRFVKTFPAVPEEFEFYVVAGDDRRDARRPHRVLLIDPPSFRQVRFTVVRPRYTAMPRPELYDGSAGVLSLPAGSRVMVEALANKPLSSASIELDGVGAGQLKARAVAAGGSGSSAAGEAWFIGEFELPPVNKAEARVLRFALADADGHVNRGGAKYLLQVQPDHAPTVEMRKSGVGARITPQAIIPLRLIVRDEYGVVAVGIRAGRSEKAGDANTVPVALPPDAGRDVDLSHELNIEPMKFQPNQTVYVWAWADDTLPASFGGPNRGQGGTMSFTVVKPEDLMEDLVRRQKELRLEFIQAMALQESARARTSVAAAIFAAGKVDAESRRELASSASAQASVGAEIAKAADTLGAIVEEMKYNRIGTDTEREQIRSGVVQPLKDLQDSVRRIRADLVATQGVEAVAELKRQAQAVEGLQKDLLARMDEILQRMTKLESKQEMANKLQLIIQWSQELLDTIRKKQEAETSTVFQPATKPATKPAQTRP